VPAAVGAKDRLVAEGEERVQLGIGDDHDRASIAAVTPIGASLGDELLAPERDAPVPAVAADDGDVSFVDEHGDVARGRPSGPF
jgi:hypothetical protein